MPILPYATSCLCASVPALLAEADLFRFFRFYLGVVVTIYASILTLQSLWGWYAWLSGRDRYVSMLRRYLIVQSLRLRFKAFWGDVIICALLTVTFFMMWHAQGIMDQILAPPVVTKVAHK